MHVLMSFQSDKVMSSKVMSNFCSSLELRHGSDELRNSSAHQAKIASDELFFLLIWLAHTLYISLHNFQKTVTICQVIITNILLIYFQLLKSEKNGLLDG